MGSSPTHGTTSFATPIHTIVEFPYSHSRYNFFLLLPLTIQLFSFYYSHSRYNFFFLLPPHTVVEFPYSCTHGSWICLLLHTVQLFLLLPLTVQLILFTTPIPVVRIGGTYLYTIQLFSLHFSHTHNSWNFFTPPHDKFFYPYILFDFLFYDTYL